MIILKSPQEIEKLRRSNKIVAGALNKISKTIDSGMTTSDLDRIADDYLLEHGAKSAFKGYRGFPNTLCTSVNCEVVHGIPSAKRKIKSGDIVSVDLGCLFDGYYGDSAITIAVGEVSSIAKKLIEVTKDALDVAIKMALPGNHLSDISHAVQVFVEKAGFSVVREFVGHGIGTFLHEDPQIPNFGSPGKGPFLKKGMVLAIEPMVNVGISDVDVLNDNWTVVTADGELSAHFEHSIAVTDRDADILSFFC